MIELARLTFLRRSLHDPRAVAELDLQIVDLGETIEARLALADPPLPLDRLRTAFQLEATEQRCLWLAFAHAVSSEVRALSGFDDGLSLEVLDRLVYASPRLRDRFARELGPSGRLLRYGLLELGDGGGSRFSRTVRVADPVIELAHGVDELAGDIAGFASLCEPPRAELLVAPELAPAVRSALQHHIDHG
ncbi:MAG TPA: hypothetical protein VF516_20085, partial [Kofleriaceae bacterium]